MARNPRRRVVSDSREFIEVFRDVSEAARDVAQHRAPDQVTEVEIKRAQEALRRGQWVVEEWIGRDSSRRQRFADGQFPEQLAKDGQGGDQDGRELVSILRFVMGLLTGALMDSIAESMLDELGVDAFARGLTREGGDLADRTIELYGEDLATLVPMAMVAIQTVVELNRLHWAGSLSRATRVPRAPVEARPRRSANRGSTEEAARGPALAERDTQEDLAKKRAARSRVPAQTVQTDRMKRTRDGDRNRAVGVRREHRGREEKSGNRGDRSGVDDR